MAKVKFSALVSEMRNKLNGSVFSKNRGGNYLRNKVTPVNPRSTYQMAKRSVFGGLSSLFRGLGATLIQAWNDASLNFPYTDIFGDRKFLSGIQLFVKLNNNLAQVDLPSIDTPPAPEETNTGVITNFVIDTSLSSFTLDVDYIPNAVGNMVVVEATIPVSPGISFMKNRYRQIGYFQDDTPPTSSDLYIMYTDRFGVPAAGLKVGVRIHVVNKVTGQVSASSSETTIVA